MLAIDPSHWRSLLNKAVVQTCTGDKEEAAFNLKLALKLSGAQPEGGPGGGAGMRGCLFAGFGG